MFKLKIDTDNAAFHNFDGEFDPSPEMSRILRGVADEIQAGKNAKVINDINGNTVGRYEFTDD